MGGGEEEEVVQGLGVGARVVLINTEVICIKQWAWLCNEHAHPDGVSERKSQSHFGKRANTCGIGKKQILITTRRKKKGEKIYLKDLKKNSNKEQKKQRFLSSKQQKNIKA